MAGNIRKSYIRTRMLRKVARSVIPFYRKIANDRNFAVRWCQAVKRGDLNRMERLFAEVIHVKIPPEKTALSTNGIGFFIDYDFPKPVYQYTNGTFLKPGTIQFHFDAVVFRKIARLVIPLYRKIAYNRLFAVQIVKAIQSGDHACLSKLISKTNTSPCLRSAIIDSDGFDLSFRFPESAFIYHNAFFRSVPC